jgi:hypothetical protein
MKIKNTKLTKKLMATIMVTTLCGFLFTPTIARAWAQHGSAPTNACKAAEAAAAAADVAVYATCLSPAVVVVVDCLAALSAMAAADYAVSLECPNPIG